MAKDTGGSAFPNVPSEGTDAFDNWDCGMTLRDYFAGQALAATIQATAGSDEVNAMATRVKGGALEAKAAYAWADAMLEARK